MIQTRRTLIRPIALTDESDLFDIYKRSEVFEHFGNGVYTREEHSSSVSRAVKKWRDTGKGDLVAQFGEIVIARLILFPDESKDYEIGYILNPDYWRNGFGSEIAAGLLAHAFELGATYVVACARQRNMVSRGILEKLNFTETHRVLGEDKITRVWYRAECT